MTLPLVDMLPVTATSPELSEQEQLIAWRLASVLFNRRGEYLLSRAFYEGMQPIKSLGISIPPELETLRAILGWNGSAVDSVSERLSLQGILLKGKSEVDDELQEIFQTNGIDAEAPMVHDDSMIHGNGYALIGTRPDGSPLITAESPLNMTAYVDRATGITTCAYQTYLDIDPNSEHYAHMRAALYTPQATTHMVSAGGSWVVTDRDEHPQTAEFGCPVVAFPNRATTQQRWGTSEILPAWRNCTNRAARTQVSLEVMREFHVIQKIMILGATEKAFQDSKGNYMSVWQSYMDFMPMIEPDAQGNVPKVEVISGQSPDGLLKIVDGEARLFSGMTGLNPQNMGIINTGNPVSGDSIRMSDFRLKSRTDRKAKANGNGWVNVAKWAYLVQGDSRAELNTAEADWGPTGIPTPGADADAAVKRSGAQLIPPRSETELARQGYSAIERENIAEEWRAADAQKLLDAVTGQLQQNLAAQPVDQGDSGEGQSDPNAVDDGSADSVTD